MGYQIKTEELIHYFGERLILNSINLEIGKGEIFGRLGMRVSPSQLVTY